MNEIVVTELIMDNFFGNYSPAEIVALLSCFICQEKNPPTTPLSPRMQEGVDVILEVCERVYHIQQECGLYYLGHPEDGLKFALIDVVQDWARGVSFKKIMEMVEGEVAEGSIIRTITRLDETCREVRDAARLVGDARLFAKMEQASAMIKRDIVFAASLYF